MFSDPKHIVSQLAVAPGSSVADLGAGVGAFSFALSPVVGASGKIYACEVQKDMLTRIENEAHERHIENIQTVWSNIEAAQGTKLRDGSIDWVIVANVLFQVEDRVPFVQEVARILKPNGSVLLVEWSDSFGNLGPHPKDVIPKPEATSLFETAGLHATAQIIDAGTHHYGVIFKKQV